MKKKSKLPLWAVIIIVEIIIVAIMYALGFKITYAPSLDNSWEAISAVASWVSAIATIFIPIVVVFFQHKLDQNKNEISDANKATLLELQKFAEKYSDLLEAANNGDTIILDGGRVVLDCTEDNVVDYIRATINVTAYDVAMYFDVTKSDDVVFLDRLVEEKRIYRTDEDGIGIYSLRK